MKANLIGPQLRLWRLQQMPKVTQDDLAARLQLAGLSLSRAGMSKIEAGLRQVTDIELWIIVQVTGQSLAWLMGQRAADGAEQGKAP